jgi:hypothetical protein
MTVHVANMPDVFAVDNGLSSEVQVDILMQAAKENLESERWIDSVENFEKSVKLGVSLP